MSLTWNAPSLRRSIVCSIIPTYLNISYRFVSPESCLRIKTKGDSFVPIIVPWSVTDGTFIGNLNPSSPASLQWSAGTDHTSAHTGFERAWTVLTYASLVQHLQGLLVVVPRPRVIWMLSTNHLNLVVTGEQLAIVQLSFNHVALLIGCLNDDWFDVAPDFKLKYHDPL